MVCFVLFCFPQKVLLPLIRKKSSLDSNIEKRGQFLQFLFLMQTKTAGFLEENRLKSSPAL